AAEEIDHDVATDRRGAGEPGRRFRGLDVDGALVDDGRLDRQLGGVLGPHQRAIVDEGGPIDKLSAGCTSAATFTMVKAGSRRPAWGFTIGPTRRPPSSGSFRRPSPRHPTNLVPSTDASSPICWRRSIGSPLHPALS